MNITLYQGVADAHQITKYCWITPTFFLVLCLYKRDLHIKFHQNWLIFTLSTNAIHDCHCWRNLSLICGSACHHISHISKLSLTSKPQNGHFQQTYTLFRKEMTVGSAHDCQRNLMIGRQNQIKAHDCQRNLMIGRQNQIKAHDWPTKQSGRSLRSFLI